MIWKNVTLKFEMIQFSVEIKEYWFKRSLSDKVVHIIFEVKIIYSFYSFLTNIKILLINGM